MGLWIYVIQIKDAFLKNLIILKNKYLLLG
jgi:hypothetical protein